MTRILIIGTDRRPRPEREGGRRTRDNDRASDGDSGEARRLTDVRRIAPACVRRLAVRPSPPDAAAAAAAAAAVRLVHHRR